ncbi:MAG: acyl-CoA synthetase [Actinobacteria bacterium]|nr:acyl-CoA synthetase [Actinomycetota bacterium]
MSEIGFWNIAEQRPSDLALIDPDGRHVTYGELGAEANRLVHGLRALGLGTGDVVATVLPNGVEMYALVFAALQAGWYLTPINFHLAGPEVAYILDDSGAKALVAHERFADVAEAAAKEAALPAGARFSVGTIAGFRPLAELTDGQPATAPADRTAGAAMHYTSGTTGRPKGVRRRLPGVDPNMIGLGMAGFLGMFGIQPGDGHVHVVGSPLYHTAVLLFSSSSLHLGHPVVVMDRWDPEEMLRLIEAHRVTTSHMVPTQLHRLLALPDEVKRRYDLSSLRCMIHAAAPCPPDVKRGMLEWWGPVIYEYYGATEGGGTIVSPQEWLERPGTVGQAWPGAEIRILDDAGAVLPPGEIGTVYMKLPEAAGFEYHKDKGKTEGNRRDGFFTVGDVGYLDADGYLFLCDRKADMIISGGVNIYPAEIEAAFLSHPAVGDVAVFGIPHPDWGEEIKAVVEPAAGVEPGPELTDSLLAHCGERLGRFKIPKTIDYVDELPRDPNGKLYKRKLRDPYWEGHERAI